MTKSVSRFQTDKNKCLATKLDGQFTLVDGAVQLPQACGSAKTYWPCDEENKCFRENAYYRAAGIDEETLLSFSREDIKDFFDGPENFLMRRKIWQIIDAHRDQENSNIVASVSDASAEISTMPSYASTLKSRGNATIAQGETIIKTSSPAFMLYSDSELAHAAYAGRDEPRFDESACAKHHRKYAHILSDA
eukprot:Seg2882.4 transcript_id=Seg2882.4/GoldUCD/mRNA.D3Y31 product="hypothetical protein" protein_id=Seg2882.4/GoldUCD/D3Y31